MKAAGSATETEGPRPARDGGRSLRGSATVLVGLVGLLATLGVSVAAVAGVAEGVRAATHPVAAPSSLPPGPATVSESMDILTGNERFDHARNAARHRTGHQDEPAARLEDDVLPVAGQGLPTRGDHAGRELPAPGRNVWPGKMRNLGFAIFAAYTCRSG